MANGRITVEKGIFKRTDGTVVFDLAKYQVIESQLKEYQGFKQKEKLLRGLKNFAGLAKWAGGFVKKNKITQKQVLEND